MEKEEVFAIKLGKNIVIGYEINGQKHIVKDKDNNSNFDYLITIDDNIEINVNEIIKYIIDEKFGQKLKDIKIICSDEIYKVEILKSGKKYLLDNILLKLFEKIKKIVSTLLNKKLNKTIIIFNNLPYELILIFHRAAFISRIQIINFLDLNKSIRFYLNYNNESMKNNSVALIKIDEKIEISIFEKNIIKRIFNTVLNKDEINFENLSLKEEINEINNQNEDKIYIQKIINKLTVKAYGIEETLNKIYIFNNTESENLNQFSIFGALYSSHFPISKEFTLILNFIDYKENYLLKELTILNKKYKINQKILEIIIDDYDIPFENCYYKNIKIYYEDNSSIENIITIYYNQKNFYSCTKDINISTSSEFIFFKNFPKITINDEYNIDIEEKFEKNQIFKRINILNVNRENIKLNGNQLVFYDYFDPSNKKAYKIVEDNLSPDILFLIGQNLNILSYFNKDILYKSSFIQDGLKKYLLDLLKYIELLNKNDSLQNLKNNQENLLQMIKDCTHYFNIMKFQIYMTGNVQNFNKYDVDLLIKYGKFLLFKEIFYNNINLELNEFNYKKYKNIFYSLNSFYEKCKEIEKDSLQLAKLFNAACSMILDYLKKNDEKSESMIFELIQFDKKSIYKDANDNNLDLILNLTKKSFLYPYFLQFNSSFNSSLTLINDNNNYIVTCKTSMITLNQIKLDLIKSLPKYGIRIFFDTDYFANTILNTDVTIYNEKKLFGHFLKKEELDNNNDINYIKRVQLSFLQKHERFSHYKKYLNKSEKDFVNSPRGILNYEENEVFIFASKEDIEKGELGESLEYIMTNGNRRLIDNLFNLKENINLKELYEINLFLESNNNNLINKLKNVSDLAGSFGNIKENIKNENKDKKDYSSNIQKKKKYFENEINIKKVIENDKDNEFEKKKIEMIRANPIKKYTFEKNTIQEYKIINGKLVPFFNGNNK